MNNNKLIALCKTFSEKQWNECFLFLKSPFFNKWQKNILSRRLAFLKYIKQALQKQKTNDSSLFNKAVIWRRIFPKKKNYIASTMSSEIQALTKVIEKFIVINKLEQNKQHQQIFLLDYYHENTDLMAPYFQKTYEEIQQNFHNSNFRDDTWFLHQFLLENIHATHMSRMTYQKTASNLKEVSHKFNLYVIYKQLEHACLFKSHPNLRQEDLPFIQYILEYLHTQPAIYQSFPVIEIFARAFHLLTQAVDDTYIQEYIQLLYKHIQLVPPIYQTNFYRYLANYIIRKINRAASCSSLTSYRKMLYEVNQKVGIDREVLYVEGKITPSDFRNIINNILAMESNGDKQIETWKMNTVQRFITVHKDKIQGEHAIDIYQFQLAVLVFHQKKYEQCLQKITNITLPSIVAYLLEYRRLTIKCYVELEDIDEETKTIGAFEVCLHRETINNLSISEKIKTSNQNFINMLKRIQKSTTYKNPKRIQKLTQDIQDTQSIAERKWLLTLLKKQS